MKRRAPLRLPTKTGEETEVSARHYPGDCEEGTEEEYRLEVHRQLGCSDERFINGHYNLPPRQPY